MKNRHLGLICLTPLLTALAAPPVLAQQVPSTPELRLPEQLDRTLRDFMDDMKPALDDLRSLYDTLGDIDDIRHYQKPEVLPNGDIIIRRRPDAPDYAPEPEAPNDEPVPEEGIRT